MTLLLLSTIYAVAITLAESAVVLINPLGGVIFHFLILFALIVHSAIVKDAGQRKLLLGLTLVPLTRILSMTIPLSAIPQIYWYPVIYAPILAATVVVIRLLNYKASDVGMIPGKYYLIPLIGLLGFGLGLVEYVILRPRALIEYFSYSGVIIPAVLLLVSTGMVEELIFRGLLQKISLEVMGGAGLYYVSYLLAILHIGFLSIADFVFVFLVGLSFAWIVKKTGSLIGVILAHGLTNITLYLLAPFFFTSTF